MDNRYTDLPKEYKLELLKAMRHKELVQMCGVDKETNDLCEEHEDELYENLLNRDFHTYVQYITNSPKLLYNFLKTTNVPYIHPFDFYKTAINQNKIQNLHAIATRYKIPLNTKENYSGSTPLQYAVEHGTPEAVETLLALGGNVNDINNQNGENALMTALRIARYYWYDNQVKDGFIRIIRSILKKSPNMSVISSGGKTTLLYMLDLELDESEHSDIIREIIQGSEDTGVLNFQTVDGDTALIIAAKINHSLGKYLLQQNSIDTKIQDLSGRTALLSVNLESPILDHLFVKSLIYKTGVQGAIDFEDISHRNIIKKLVDTLVVSRLKDSNRIIIQDLLKQGLQYSQKAHDVLDYTLEFATPSTIPSEIIKDMLKRLRNVKQQDGDTLLMTLLLLKDNTSVTQDIFEMILNLNGLDINAQNDDGDTALILFFKKPSGVFKTRDNLLKLLDKRPDVNIENEKGLNAYSYAIMNTTQLADEEILDKLKALGAKVDNQYKGPITRALEYAAKRKIPAKRAKQ